MLDQRPYCLGSKSILTQVDWEKGKKKIKNKEEENEIPTVTCHDKRKTVRNRELFAFPN